MFCTLVVRESVIWGFGPTSPKWREPPQTMGLVLEFGIPSAGLPNFVTYSSAFKAQGSFRRRSRCTDVGEVATQSPLVLISVPSPVRHMGVSSFGGATVWVGLKGNQHESHPFLGYPYVERDPSFVLPFRAGEDSPQNEKAGGFAFLRNGVGGLKARRRCDAGRR